MPSARIKKERLVWKQQPSVGLSVCPSVRLSVFLSVRLSVCPSVCLSVCLSVRLSVCLSVFWYQQISTLTFIKFYRSSLVRVIKSRRMRWVGHVAWMGEDRGVYRILVGKPERRRPLGRPRSRWEDNIRMDL
jgi:hypothetical protein